MFMLLKPNDERPPVPRWARGMLVQSLALV